MLIKCLERCLVSRWRCWSWCTAIFNTPVVSFLGVKSKNVKNIQAGWDGYVSVSFSSGKVSRNKIALKRCTSTLTPWKRNRASNGSPERSVILRPISARQEAVVSPRSRGVAQWLVWLNCLWLKLMSGRMFSVLWAFPVGSLFSDHSCCMTCCGQVGSSYRGADCDISC